jgi:hypothetical protein
MPEQEDLLSTTKTEAPRRTFNPLEHGIYRRFVDEGGRIKDAVWRNARGVGEAIGTCRNCGSDIVAGAVDEVNEGRTDYRGGCLTCGREFCAPGGKTLTRSGIARERPSGHRRRPENAEKTSPTAF